MKLRIKGARLLWSGLVIYEEDRAHQHEGDRPYPAGNAVAGRIKPKLEPAGPACGHAKHREGRVRDLDQQLILDIGKRVLMGEQQRARERADQRKYQGCPLRADAARAHAPLEDAEARDQHDEDSMLRHLRIAEAREKADIAEWPDLGIAAEQQEYCKPNEQQWPMPRPGREARAL